MIPAPVLRPNTVARYERGDLIVNTCMVLDPDRPYETGIKCPAYNQGRWIIVAEYRTAKAARCGHKTWVARMKRSPLPERLVDVSSSVIAWLRDASGEVWRVKPRKIVDLKPGASAAAEC